MRTVSHTGRRHSHSPQRGSDMSYPYMSSGSPQGAMRWIRLLLLSIVVFFTFFVNNGVLEPDIMESRNLITAREMLETERYMAPTMNGELRLAKPPLPTWIAAAVESVSPDNVPMQRAASGAAGVLLTLFVYLFARRTMRMDPLWPTLLLLTCYNVVLMGRTASWDIYCHAFMMGGIYFLSQALRGQGRCIAYFAWSGFFTGLSILSKGPVSLFALLLPWLLATLCVARTSMKGKWGGVALMVAVALICGCWWYAYIYMYHAQELHAVAAQESGAWMHRNVRPFWYYHKFYLEAGVWALLLITAVILCWKRPQGVKGYLLPLLWMLFSLVLLSLLPEKKTRYLLPVLIPAALLMGQLVNRWIIEFRTPSKASPADKTFFRINAWLLAVVVAAIPFAAWWYCYAPGFMPLWVFAVIVIASGVTSVSIALGAVRLDPRLMVWSVAFLFVAAEGAALPCIKPLINNPDMRSIKATAQMPALKGIPFYSNAAEELRIELVYAARRDITPVAFTDSALASIPLPAVILTHRGAAAELPQSYLAKVDTTYIGRYDDNRRPKDTKRYDPIFIYHLTLIQPRSHRAGAPADSTVSVSDNLYQLPE